MLTILKLYTDNPINNERYLAMTFDLKEAAVLHGFAGYFDTILYDDITLSKQYHSVCISSQHNYIMFDNVCFG